MEAQRPWFAAREPRLTAFSKKHSSGRVLRDQRLAAVFDQQEFPRALFPLVFIDHWGRTDCPVTFSEALARCMSNYTEAKWCHNMPEVSFIHFLSSNYSLRTWNAPPWPDSRSRTEESSRMLVFLPIWCAVIFRASHLCVRCRFPLAPSFPLPTPGTERAQSPAAHGLKPPTAPSPTSTWQFR